MVVDGRPLSGQHAPAAVEMESQVAASLAQVPLKQTALQLARNHRSPAVTQACAHGPWGRDSPECWLLYGDLDVFRRNNPNIIVQIRVR